MMVEQRNFGQRVQALFDWTQDCLSAVENRWLIFLLSVAVLAILRALGAQGLSTLLALIYIMYFVTLGRNHRRDL
jgi:hypothetical protein